MAYLELLVRCVTERGLLRSVLHFIFVYEYDGVRIIDVLLRRLEGTSQLSLVSLALMETLIDINCEDVTIDLIYKYLLNGHHLMASHRYKITNSEFYRDAAIAYLSLTPRCCQRSIEKTRQWVDELALSGRRVLDFRKEEDRKYNGVHEDIAMNNLVQEVKFNYGNPNETLYGNYHAYLCDARFEIVSRAIACKNWNSKYDAITTPKRETNNNSTKETKEIDNQNNTKEQDSLISICTSEYDTLKTSDTSEKEQHSLTSFTDNIEETKVNDNENSDIKEVDNTVIIQDELKERDNVSIGESSDYESFKDKAEDENEGFAEDLFNKSFEREENEREYEVPELRSWRASAESIIGPLLSGLLKKVAVFLESEVVVNCRVTSVLSRLASLPTPLLTSLLLCPGFVLAPNVPSLFQILNTLKEEVDELTEGLENISELVDKARVYLIQRELALAKSRGPNNEDSKAQTHESPTHRSDESPFRRTESKRRSFSSSFSSMFARRLSSSSPSQQHSPSPQHTSPHKRPVFTQEAYWNQSITLRSVLNAVLFDEWLKELAALCEEHALRLSSGNYEDDTFVRTVAL